MALTLSKMTPLGTTIPSFSLPEVTSGQIISLDNLPPHRPILVLFICRHCPYVKHVQEELAKLGRDYSSRVTCVAISANDAVHYPDDAPGSLREQAREAGFTFSYLYDQTQDVAKAFGATCTPDFFLYDTQRRLFYRGQLDDSRPGNNRPVNGRDLRGALDALIQGQPAPTTQHPSAGCNIKWK